MKKLSVLIAIVLAVVMLFCMTACTEEQPQGGGETTTSASSGAGTASVQPDPKVEQTVVDLSKVNGDGVTVKMSVLYDNKATRMRFISGSKAPYDSSVMGKTYKINDWKPAWAQLKTNLNFNIEDVTNDKAESVSGAFTLFQANEFKNVHVLSGSVTDIVEQATNNGRFVDLAPYIENGDMPYLKAFLDQNELVKNTVTSSAGQIFYAPYFDGYDDVENMFILRKDWVEKLLDGDPDYDTTTVVGTFYKPYYKQMNTTLTVANAAGTGTKNVTVSYAAGNGIIDKQNALSTKNGKNLTEALKTYIDTVYGSTFAKRSDLFCGQDACYNADEMVALLRCVKANPQLLSGTSVVYPFYPRDKNVNRCAAILQLAQLWGARGYDSRNGYFYVDANGYLAEGRTSNEMMEALGYIHQLYQEGLIVENYEKGIGSYEEYRDYLNGNNQGFMTYDYNQTTTILNTTLYESNPVKYEGINLTPIMFPVADWDHKATANAAGGYTVNGNMLYQYTESWRSLKSEAWAITYATALNEPAIFKKCIEMFDYMYSPEGHILMSYGPDAYMETKDASIDLNSLDINASDYDAQLNALMTQKYECIDYYGKKVPKISAAALNELNDSNLGGGNYTNYYRYFVGATLPIGYVKEQGMEYQTVDEKGSVGLQYIVNAVQLGTLKHAQVNKGADGNLANSLVPTVFPLTKSQNDIISNYCGKLGTNFNNTSGAGYNEFHKYVQYGFGYSSSSVTTLSVADFQNQIKKDWGGSIYFLQYFNAYNVMYRIKISA